MNRNLLWKFLFVVFVLLWSVWELTPLTPRNLLDEFANRAVNPDTNFTAMVQQARQLQQGAPELAFQNIRRAVGTNDITRYFPFVNVKGQKDPNLAVLHRLQKDAAGQIQLGLDLQGGTEFVVRLGTGKLDTNSVSQSGQRDLVVQQAIEVLRKRVDKFGVAEPIIQPLGSDMIQIQLPGLSEADKESARNTLSKPAVLEFRLVHPDNAQLLRDGLAAPGYETLYEKKRRKDGAGEEYIPYLVKKNAERGLTGKYVSQARVVPDPISNQPEIALSFNTEGDRLFSDVTREHVGEQLAIVLDGELYSAPVIQQAIIGGHAQITGNFSLVEAYELVNVLQNPLETKVTIDQERSVEPSLGKDSIRSGVRSAIIGTILVAAFMLVYYLFAGLVANVALVLNVIILLGVLASIDTTLTLPGIAGIVLTIGMAVDANVLIFERIREELEANKSLRGALAAGYDKAFGTIFDANLTTLIASVVLIWLGTGPVQGFGVTLTIGVTVSMFTALVVTRLVFDWLLVRGWLKSLTMLRFFGKTKIDFLKWSKAAFILSWLLAIIGLGYGFYRGKGTLGVEFTGGDRTMFTFAQKVDVGKLRDAVIKLGVGEPMLQYQKDLAGGGKELLQITAAPDSGPKIQQALVQQFPDAKFENAGTFNVGPSIGRALLQNALMAVLLSLFGILLYVALRYEFSFAFAAVLAVVHDIFMTVGWFCLTGREFSGPMVAAILTIIGFSINDTIVIFDRIREDLKLGVRGSFKDLINQALNQTLSRTVITSGTVFLATIALYAFGGPVINDFSFTFLVGIITGTYSSIYIASSIVLWWHKGLRPKTSSQVVMDQPVTTRA
jgi:SecD/SecF fusion protein